MVARDLYHSVKFLWPYAFPAGIPSPVADSKPGEFSACSKQGLSSGLPQPVTTARARTSQSTIHDSEPKGPTKRATIDSAFEDRQAAEARGLRRHGTYIEEGSLLPARNPPKYTLFDFFPFSLLIGCLSERGQSVTGRKAARLQAKMRSMVVTHNLPLELSLYLVRLARCLDLELMRVSFRVRMSLRYKSEASVMILLSVCAKQNIPHANGSSTI